MVLKWYFLQMENSQKKQQQTNSQTARLLKFGNFLNNNNKIYQLFIVLLFAICHFGN